MTTRYYDDQRKGRNDYTTTDYYYSHSGPRNDDYYGSDTKTYYRRSPSRDLVRYDDRRHDDRHHSERRQRSLSPSHLRKDHGHEHSHGHRRGGSDDHHRGKDLAATLLGAAVGGSAAKHGSHGSKLSVAAGALVGAWGGHELEKTWEHHEDKERTRRGSMDRGR